MNETRRTIAAAMLAVALALILYAIQPAFFVKDDFQLQYLPGSREVARAWTHGELPLLSRDSWLCAGLAAEYQFGVFSIFRALLDVLVWALPLSLTARGAFLFIVHAAIAAAGAYRLARSFDARAGASFMVAIVAALNGATLWWGTTWFPSITAFAWLPWYWLGLRRNSFLLTALSLYLLVSAGWPYAVLMAFAVALTAVVRRQWRMCIASALGFGLAAPAVLMLLEYFPYTARDSAATAIEQLWAVPPAGLFAFIVPAFSATWKVFAGALPHPGVELLGAFVPLAALAAAARRDFVRRHLPELVLLAALLVLLLLPSAGPFRWSFRWLPLVHLLLALLGSVVLDHRAAKFGLGLLALTAVAAIAFSREPQATLLHAAIFAALCVIWLFVDHPALPVAITMAMILLTFATFSRRSEVPIWRYDAALLDAAPLDPARRYLAMYDFASTTAPDAYGRRSRGRNAALRPGNIPMLSGVEFINGYSPLGLAAMRNVFDVDAHGPMNARRAELLLRQESGPEGLLHQLGVDGLIMPEAMAVRHAAILAPRGWTPVARINDALVLHHERIVSPVFRAAVAFKTTNEQQAYSAIFDPRIQVVVLYTQGDGKLTRYFARDLRIAEARRNETRVVYEDLGPKTLLVFRRPWLPGWRATVDGKPVPVLRANMIMPAVEVPADGFDVRLFYRPTSLVAGLAIAALSLIVLAWLAAKT
ncbi:MAG TPA: hypothetical protein VND45_02490 [Thermoanaerobaculia bacterium]|nr:hypothetical protein [Thermoanaerobaculia bacterium]